jgi:hypothetical protein
MLRSGHANMADNLEEITMQKTSTRRTFIQIFPLAGITMIAACSDKQATPPPAPAPEPTSAPAPTPAPAPAPTPAPAAEPASASTPAPAEPAKSGSAGPMVDEKDPQALALGYVTDAAHVDKVKYAKFAVGSHCANCSLFLGKAGDAAGGCPLYAGKQVSATGWCSAWVKKA